MPGGYGCSALGAGSSALTRLAGTSPRLSDCVNEASAESHFWLSQRVAKSSTMARIAAVDAWPKGSPAKEHGQRLPCCTQHALKDADQARHQVRARPGSRPG